MFGKRSAPQWAVIGALVLLLATTALAAAQSPDLLLPLVTGGGQTDQAEPEMPLPSEPDPAASIGDSRDTNSGDYDVPADIAAVDAFNATQWTVQNNLGIGTDAPTADIDLSRNVNNYTRVWVHNPNSGGNAQTQLYLNTASSNGLAVQQFGSGYSATWNGKSLKDIARLRTTLAVKGLILTTGGPYPLILGTADQERMRITPAGKVGIGTTTPAHQLSIAGGPQWTINGWFGAVELANVSAIGWGANDSGYSFGMGHTTGGFYFFRTPSAPGTTGTSATYDMIIKDNGSVGIGVFPSDPYIKLHVKGSTLIEGGHLFVTGGNLNVDGVVYADGYQINTSAQLNVPDYVFEPEYPLMSLDELRTYVATEKHLPNVPDEEEIRSGGLDLSDFQMKLLEKTEELTLYTLAQDEQITSLQQDNQAKDEQLENQGEQIEALQKMIADLEARLGALEAQE